MVTIAQAEVEILYFRGVYQDDNVFLEWKTDTEVDLNGFFITRSNAQDGLYMRISNRIPNTGDENLGVKYNFTDMFILNDTTYWYRLEAVDINNQVIYSDPVQIVTGPAYTPDSPLVSTPTGSPTATELFASEQVNPTSTSTSTAPLQRGTITATAAEPTSLTPTGTISLGVTEAISPTVTLIPLPEITLQFPTPVTSLDISSDGSAKIQDKSSEEQRGNILSAIGRVIFLGFIALIWVVLAVWFYLASRRVE